MGWGKGQGCGQKAEIVVLNFYHEWEGNGSVVPLRQLVLGPNSLQLTATPGERSPQRPGPVEVSHEKLRF